MTSSQQRLRQALTADPIPLIEWAILNLAHLGGKLEWSMDDNRVVAETLAMLPDRHYGLPSAGDQDDEALRFYGEIALEIGLTTDYVPDPPDYGNDDDDYLDALAESEPPDDEG